MVAGGSFSWIDLFRLDLNRLQTKAAAEELERGAERLDAIDA
jgi:hypothetical protein